MISSALRVLVATPNVNLYKKRANLLGRFGYPHVIYSGEPNTTIKLVIRDSQKKPVNTGQISLTEFFGYSTIENVTNG